MKQNITVFMDIPNNEKIEISKKSTEHLGEYPILKFGENFTLYPSFDQLKELHSKLGEFLSTHSNHCLVAGESRMGNSVHYGLEND